MKKKILYFFSLLFILLIVLRASYAYYIKSYSQENSNIVKTKCLNLSITNEKNDIMLDEQYPIPDSEGKKLTPYQFTIINTCEQFISYNVNLEALEGTTMDSNAIKVMVNNEAPVNLATLDVTQTSINNSVESRTLVTGSLGSGDSVDYALRLWMDYGDSADLSSMNKVFNSKVVVTATIGTYKPSDYVTTLHDAILVNEYGVTDVNNAISKIEAKGEPDLNQTAPIITWQETEQSKTTQNVTKPANSALNSLETFSDINKNEQLMHICTTKTFDNSSARYILSNCSLLDPTELEYNSDIKYYYSKEYVAFDQSANKFYISTTYNSPTIYQIINATKSLSTATTNNISYNAIYYNLSVIPLAETEYEADKSDKGLYVADDDYGKTYYYRGNVSNNNVYFAGVYWQIVRINGDASIRMIYNGEELASTNIKKGINNKLYQFNNIYNHPMYVGYMYGAENSTTFSEANKNENSAPIKKEIDTWYFLILVSKNFNRFISETVGFCGDRSLSGYENEIPENTNIRYNSWQRFNKNSGTFKCSNINEDLYTTSNSSIGNKSLTYPVGLITYDELAFSGMKKGIINTLSWSFSSSGYWTMTPSAYNAVSGHTNIILQRGAGYIDDGWPDSAYSIRPVINLKSDVKISGGIGTINDPYVVDTNN